MNKRIMATMIAASFAASCAVKVQVKKEAKNSQLNSSNANATTQLNSTDAENFLKHLDGLRNTAADLIIKQMAQKDYVGTFRSSVRKYRKFIIEKSAKEVNITDRFYTDSAKDCRESGLSLNADNHNEMLGLILKTAVLAKLSEVDVAKINSGLAKELQAVTQFITLELGVEILGTSEVTEQNGSKTTKGNVKIKLKPISGEQIDDATKSEDEVQVLSLSFERTLGSGMIGTFAATIDLSFEEGGITKEASGNLTVARSKANDLFTHEVLMTIGIKGSSPSYARQIVVRDVKDEKMKFEFSDILNATTNRESHHETIVDLKAKTQCKVKGGQHNEDSNPNTPEVVETPVVQPTSGPTPPPTQTPSQSPVQTKVKGKSSQAPVQMKN